MCYATVLFICSSLFVCLVLSSLALTVVQIVIPSYQWIFSEDSYLARCSPYCIYAVISAGVYSFVLLHCFFQFI